MVLCSHSFKSYFAAYLIVVVLIFSSAPTAWAVKPSKIEKKAAQQHLTLASVNYYFHQMGELKSIAYKLLINVPEDNAKGKFAELPIIITEYDYELQRLYGLSSPTGLMVGSVLEGFETEGLDIQIGDEVLILNDQPVKNEKDMMRILEKLTSDRTAFLTLRRGIREFKVEVPIIHLARKISLNLNSTYRNMRVYPDMYGNINVTPLLLDYLQNRDELAFLLAYFIGLKVQNNVTSKKDSKFRSNYVGLMGFLTGGNYLASSLPPGFAGMSDSKKHSAQVFALDLIAKSGFSQDLGSRLWKRLMVDNISSGAYSNGFIPEPSLKNIILLERQQSGNANAEVSKEEEINFGKKVNKERFDSALDKLVRVQSVGYRLLHGMEFSNQPKSPALPVCLVNINPVDKEVYGIEKKSGVMVADVMNELVNKKINLERGDEILKVSNESVDSLEDIDMVLNNIKGSDQVMVEVKRASDKIEEAVPLYSLARRRQFLIEREDGQINAFADIHGRVRVTPGMLRFLNNDDELAAIIGHELAHHERHHIRKGVSNNMVGTVAGTAVGMVVENYVPGLGEASGVLAGAIITSPYSKELEKEADSLGLQYMIKAGYSGKSAYAVWERFAVKSPGTSTNSFATTHPASAERFLILKKLIEGDSELTIRTESSPGEVERDKSEKVGPIFESASNPEAVGISEMGLAQQVRRSIRKPKIVNPGNIFNEDVGDIVWYAIFSNLGQIKNSFSKNFHIEWYRPDGSLFSNRDIRPYEWDTTLMVEKISFEKPMKTILLGRWRVKVFKGEILIDDRYFFIRKITDMVG